ncbi:MAG: hypothetical protein AAGU10_08370 [Methanosarcina mazei]
MKMENQNIEQEFVEVTAPTNPEQKDGYKNDSLVYISDSIILKTFGAEESIKSITEIIKADIEAFVQLVKGLLKPCNCDCIFTSESTSSRCGINPNYWTTFVRVIKRVKFYQMVGC